MSLQLSPCAAGPSAAARCLEQAVWQLRVDRRALIGSGSAARTSYLLERGKKEWRVPVQGPVVTDHVGLRQMLAEAGVGLIYAFEPTIADSLRGGRLRLVLDADAPLVQGLFLYFPSRAQVSPALRAFVGVARDLVGRSRSRAH